MSKRKPHRERHRTDASRQRPNKVEPERKQSSDVARSTREHKTARSTGNSAASEGSSTTRAGLTGSQTLLSLIILIHFSSLFVAYGSNLFQSMLQQRAMQWLSPYLVGTAQAYGAMPLEWTHAEPFDMPLEVQLRGAQDDRWVAFLPKNETPEQWSHSRWQNLARVLRIVAEDDPESEILSELVFQFVRFHQNTDPGITIQSIRLLQPAVLDFDEAELLAFDDAVASLPQAEVIFQAGVVRAQNGELLGLVPQLESYRSAKTGPAVPPNSSAEQRGE